MTEAKDDTTSVQAVLNDGPLAHELLKVMRHLSVRIDQTVGELGSIREALAGGAPVIEAVKTLPTEFAVLKSEVATLKAVVYGGVALCCVGTLTTAGACIIIVLRMAGAHP